MVRVVALLALLAFAAPAAAQTEAEFVQLLLYIQTLE